MAALSPPSAEHGALAQEIWLCDLASALRYLTLARLSDASERQACYAHAGLITAAGISFADDIEARRRATLRLRHCPPTPAPASIVAEPLHA